MRRLLGLVVVALLVAGCASATGVTDSTVPPTPATTTTATSSIVPTPTPSQTTTPRSHARIRAEVISVTDGDTIRVRIDGQSVPVRYIGIDTPETVDPRRSVECFGREASAFNAQLVSGGVVELEKDVSETDRFGRLLRYVYVDGKMVNEELVRNGYASAISYPPDVKYQDRLRELEALARAQERGLWAEEACASVTETPATTPVRAETSAPAGSPSSSATTPMPVLTSPASVPSPSESPTPTTAPTPATPAPTAAANCEPAYPTVCIPPYPPDLDCGEIPYRRFEVLPPDPHGLDGRDNDGIGCES